jgi:diketogulonate reductase-like aldo/keto reductase
MNEKELGKTGVRLPEIGLGTWQYHAGVEPIKKAIVLGVSLIDTAESYGTEAIVGDAVKHLRDSVFIAECIIGSPCGSKLCCLGLATNTRAEQIA